ncbi:glycosyltransferase family protein [Blastococcus capsensis]|uniref:glycosyltransferase family protein n=1 Tax=Blastococcus capsensis TaxID=1564163 RepID=UPI00253F6CCA|nr:glycosyltransferase [Blastococcus capsensis]MDK3257128.1 glycosyltransferase [Blastococcus capsensis]
MSPDPSSLQVVYVAPVPMAPDNASKLRIENMCRAVAAAGLPPVRIGSGDPVGVRGELADGAARFEGLGEIPLPSTPRARRVARGLTWGAATRAWVRDLQPRPDVVVVYGTHLGYLVRLRPEARRHGFALVPDVVEWYDAGHLPLGRFGPFALANELAMRVVAPRSRDVIVISSYLERWFARHGSRVLRVPPLFPVTPTHRPPSADGRLTLAYAGNFAEKDRPTVLNLLRLPTLVPDAGDRLRIDLVGSDATEARRALGPDAAAVAWDSPVFRWRGRVDNAAARALIGSADFVVLQRSAIRSNLAGYPSKVAESLSLGTPVMTNPTSDLGTDLTHGRDAWLLRDESLDALVEAVRDLLAAPRPAVDRAAVLRSAERLYSPASHADRLRDFLVDAVAAARPGRT